MDVDALWLTLRLAAWTTAILLLVALPLAWWIASGSGPIRAVIQAIVALPLVLPPTVIGFYLLVALGPLTAVGRLFIRWAGHPLAFSFAGLLVGSALYSLPFAVQPLVAGFGSVDPGYLESSSSLGVSPTKTFFGVMLPMARGSLLTAAVLTFTHTVGEFGVVLMLGGNIPGATRTLSIALYDQVQEFNYAAANRTALVLLGVAAAPRCLSSISFQPERPDPGRTLGRTLGRTPGRPSLPADAPILQLALQHQVGRLQLDLDFTLRAPWTVLFGASGSGKTTILRMVQGLSRPRSGRIRAGGSTLVDTQNRISLPPHQRPVRSAAQAERLFPHKTMLQNLAWAQHTPASCAELTAELLRLFHVEPLAQKYPHELSGGERQRISVARAVLSAATCQGALLLLDEPFSGLGLPLRDALALDLRTWLRRRTIPVLSVTHDVSEAFLLEAEVLRLEEGRIVDQGPAARVLNAERRRLLHALCARPAQ